MRIERRDDFYLWIGGPVPRGADGITVGRFVMVRAGHEESGYLLRHEQVHVRQWRRHGPIMFLAHYFGSYAALRLRRFGHRNAYLRIPFEIEADWVARRTAPTHRDVSVPEIAARR